MKNDVTVRSRVPLPAGDHRNRPAGYKRAMTCRLACFVGSFLFLVPTPVGAQGLTVIEIAEVQFAPALSGLVQESAGSPLGGVLVEELNSDWKTPVRSTRTAADGRFAFPAAKDSHIHYFQFSLPNFDPLRVRIKLNRTHKNELRLQLAVAT
jgi:hypothetical protein